jgi:hypothetical protein
LWHNPERSPEMVLMMIKMVMWMMFMDGIFLVAEMEKCERRFL